MWYDESSFYQIYPLGLFGAPRQNDFKLEHRLKKAGPWLEHAKVMGFQGVLFNPVISSGSHGYDTVDFFKVDERLGDREDLKAVVDKAHDLGLKVLFDGVFNHVGRGFGPFQDVLKNREASRYKDWFNINFGGNNSYNDGLWYENWEGHDMLVKLNLNNPEVRGYLMSVVDDWMDFYGIDGIRFDVAYCLTPDFLRQVHDHAKGKREDFFLMGECLHGDYNQWCNPQMMDSVTNYECFKGIHSSFNSHNFFEILYSFNRQFGKENWCLYTGKNLWSFLDNHDVMRIASNLENPAHLPLAYGMLFTMPGIPCVYYGSEWGIKGDKNQGDDALRPELDKPVDNELSQTVKKLAEIRKDSKALQYGDYTQIALQNEWAIYQLSHDGQTIWYAVNIADHPMDIPVPFNGKAKDLLKDEELEINGALHLDENAMKILELE